MDINEKEMLISDYLPGRPIEALAVAFAKNYLNSNSTMISMTRVCDVLQVTPSALKDLMSLLDDSRLMKGQQPERLKQLAEINSVRYDKFKGLIRSVAFVHSNMSPGVRMTDLALGLANNYLQKHKSATSVRLVSEAFKVTPAQLNELLGIARANLSLFKPDPLNPLQKMETEQAGDNLRLLARLDEIKYVRSEKDRSKKAEDINLAFAKYYLKNNNSPEDKERLFNMLKFDESIFNELYAKALERPLLKGHDADARVKELAGRNYKQYCKFYERVKATDVNIQGLDNGYVTKIFPSRMLGAAVHLIGTGEYSTAQLCELFEVKTSVFRDAAEKLTSSEKFLDMEVDHPEKKEAYLKSIDIELQTIRSMCEHGLTPGYRIDVKGVYNKKWENINTCDEKLRGDFLFFQPELYSALDSEQRTYEHAMIACKSDGLVLQQVRALSPRLVDLDLCMAAVKSNGNALQFMKKQFRTREVCYAAVRRTPEAYRFVPRNLKGDRRLIHLAINKRGGGENIQFLFEKDKTKFICKMAGRTFSEAHMFYPRRFAPSDNELKRKRQASAMSRTGAATGTTVINVTPQDYFDLYPSLGQPEKEAISQNFAAVKDETEKYVTCVAGFYNGKMSADDVLTNSPLKGRYPDTGQLSAESKYYMATLDTYGNALHHPELVQSEQLNPNFKPEVWRDFSGVGVEDFIKLSYPKVEGMDAMDAKELFRNLYGQYTDSMVQGAVHLCRQEAELSIAYRNNEISADKFLSTLPVGGAVPDGSDKELKQLADSRSQFWADRFPEMLQANRTVSEDVNRSGGVKR